MEDARRKDVDSSKDLFIEQYGVDKYAKLVSQVPKGLRLSNSYVYQKYKSENDVQGFLGFLSFSILLFIVALLLGFMTGLGIL